MNNHEPVVGIDLGTTNSAVAVIQNGRVEIVEDGDRGILPSCVGIDDQGGILVGVEARNQAVAAPDRTVLSVKRQMGLSETLVVGGENFSPQEISALILKSLKLRAEHHIKAKISKAVITVPAYFTDAQRQATRQAGELAGLSVQRIINEPTAAALAYGSSDVSEDSLVLVYDLGGGTFDVSLVRMEEGVVEVMASTGDNRLGGDDFDEILARHLVETIRKEKGTDLSGDTFVMARLLRAAEQAKIDLSTAPFVRIEEDHLARSKDGTDIHLSTEISREMFEGLIEGAIEATMEAVTRALQEADVLPSSLDRILLVGGSTRMPMIARMIEERLGIAPHAEIDPDLCVAMGAGIQAGREMGVENAAVLIDITPYTFGTSAIGDLDGVMSPFCFVPMIKKQTRLPATRSEVFFTMADGQELVILNVYQGEHNDALENIQIGEFSFKLSGLKQGTPVVLTYTLDVNGILKLEAVEKPTGKKLKAVIQGALSAVDDEELLETKGRLDALLGDGDESWEAEEGVAAEAGTEVVIPSEMANTLTDAEAKMDSASEEDRDEMVNLMEDLRLALKNSQMDDAKALHAELEDLLFYMD